ncbi:endonuclease/exonuclease/phosphatase family protein [Pseudooceanicola sp. C21-150M6]|uniref:endonuclease/exonuclease/phosphatase family protein n=1 Tax=Pseudooceanicola sp. C21-150M6 TaxID=3434355 RepID=UPI003D7F8A82
MKAPILTLTSWNLQKCVGLDLQRNPQRSLQVLAATGAELAVLQEVDKRLPPRPAALLHDMVESDGWHILPFSPVSAGGPSLGWHGNAMIARPGVTARSTHRIELPGLEPRGAIRAELDTPLGPLRVIGVHLGLIRRYRLLQLAAIRRALALLPPAPTVITGDFNEWGAPRVIEHEIAPLRLVPTPPTYPAPRPIGRLDRIALSADLTVAEPPRAHIAQPARIASDHLPLVVRLARRDGA